MFTLKESPFNGTIPRKEYYANATINKGDALVQVTGNAYRADPVAANVSATTLICGVAEYGGNAGDKISVIPPLPGLTWLAQANENSAITNCGTLYGMATAGNIGYSAAIANNGGRVVLLAPFGAANLNTYEVAFVQTNCRGY